MVCAGENVYISGLCISSASTVDAAHSLPLAKLGVNCSGAGRVGRRGSEMTGRKTA